MRNKQTKYIEANVSFPISIDIQLEKGLTLADIEKIAVDLVATALRADDRVDWYEINDEHLWTEPLEEEADEEEE